jgi:hypothetical protein
MKTTRKQLVNFAIGLVKEVSKQNNKDINVVYRNSKIKFRNLQIYNIFKLYLKIYCI